MSKQHYRSILIVLTVACGLGTRVDTPSALYLALAAFNAPGSAYRVWARIVGFLSIPVWFVIGALAGWVLHLHDWLRAALVAAATPFVATAVGWLIIRIAV